MIEHVGQLFSLTPGEVSPPSPYQQAWWPSTSTTSFQSRRI